MKSVCSIFAENENFIPKWEVDDHPRTKLSCQISRIAYLLKCMFPIFYILTDNSIKLIRGLKQCLQIYENCHYELYLYLEWPTLLQMTAFRVLKILPDTFDGRPLPIFE